MQQLRGTSVPLSRRQNSTRSCVGLEKDLISADPFEQSLASVQLAQPWTGPTCAPACVGSQLLGSGFWVLDRVRPSSSRSPGLHHEGASRQCSFVLHT